MTNQQWWDERMKAVVRMTPEDARMMTEAYEYARQLDLEEWWSTLSEWDRRFLQRDLRISLL